MKVIYFPHTYITEPTCRILGFFLGKPSVFQPSSTTLPDQMQNLASENDLNIIIPDFNDNGKDLVSIVKNYKEWINLHSGDSLTIKEYTGETPFFNDNTVRKLSDDIRKNKNNAKEQITKAQEKQDPLLSSRIFLQISQEFDTHNHESSEDIKKIESNEQKMFIKLSSGTSNPEKILSQKTDNSSFNYMDYMIEKRLKAWSHVYQYAVTKKTAEMSTNKNEDTIFVTCSKEAFRHFFDIAPETNKIFDLRELVFPEKAEEKSDGLQKMVSDYIRSLLKKEDLALKEKIMGFHKSSSPCKKISMQICVIPDISPYALFNDFINREHKNTPFTQKTKTGNTIIILVESGWH